MLLLPAIAARRCGYCPSEPESRINRSVDLGLAKANCRVEAVAKSRAAIEPPSM